MEEQSLLHVEDMTMAYRETAVIWDIDLDLPEGVRCAIVGPNGAGKSTLLKGILGLQQPVSGFVRFWGKPIGEVRARIAYVPQRGAVNWDFPTTVFDVVLMGRYVHIGLMRRPGKADRQIAKEALAEMKLTELADRQISELSGGQKQRVSLAGVLIDESPILLFDEPLANLDPKSGQDIIELIDQIHKEEGTTTLIIEHRLEDVLHRPVDRIVLINDGRILFNGSPDQLLATDLLTQNGIREPLYLTTLRQLGVDLAKEEQLANLDNLSISKGQIQLRTELVKETPELQSLFKLEDVSFSYDDRPILKSIYLDIKKGEKIAIVGKNGAGKSTLAKAISSFIQTEGRYLWEEQDIKGDSVAERAERVGYVLQNPNQMISTNMIFDEVALGLRLRGVNEKEIETRVYETLKICGLYEFRNWPISALSFGQKKRVTIASILVLGAEIILLDEPTAGQDQKNYTEIMEFLEELHQKGHTIVMITHDMQLMLDYSDRALVMVDGELIADTDPASLLSNPELLVKANLKETSIFNLAKKLDVDPLALTAFYKERREGCKLN